MSDDEDGPRHDAETDEVDDPADAVDSLDDPADAVDSLDDPFAELGNGAGANGAESDAGSVGSGGPSGDGADPSPLEDAPEADRSDPFDELGPPDAERDDTFGETPGDWDDEADDLDDAFEQIDVGGPAEEDVWESLDADAADAFGAAGLGGATSVPGGRDIEHVVSKRTYCQQCPHFTSPPEAACTHEGTTIVEAVGFDEFRVRNCPMVSEENPTFDADE